MSPEDAIIKPFYCLWTMLLKECSHVTHALCMCREILGPVFYRALVFICSTYFSILLLTWSFYESIVLQVIKHQINLAWKSWQPFSSATRWLFCWVTLMIVLRFCVNWISKIYSMKRQSWDMQTSQKVLCSYFYFFLIVWWLHLLSSLLLFVCAAIVPGLCQQQMLSFPLGLPVNISSFKSVHSMLRTFISQSFMLLLPHLFKSEDLLQLMFDAVALSYFKSERSFFVCLIAQLQVFVQRNFL